MERPLTQVTRGHRRRSLAGCLLAMLSPLAAAEVITVSLA